MDAAIRALHQRSSLAGFPLDRKGVTARDVHSRVAVAAFLENLNLVRTSALSELKGVRLGVEATHWLSSIKVEPLLLATGGSPESLRGHLSDLIAKLGAATDASPLFVFDGLHLMRESDPRNLTARVAQAWSHVDHGRANEGAFQEVAPNASDASLSAFVMDCMRGIGAGFMRAPCRAWPQLSYMVQHKHLDAVWGSDENLLFAGARCGKLVLSVNWAEGTYDWVDGPSLLDTLAVTEEQFVDACIIAGTGLSAPSPVLVYLGASDVPFDTILRFVQTHGDGRKAIVAASAPTGSAELSRELLEPFNWTRTAVRHHLIMYAACKVEPLDSPNAPPAEILSVLGPKLPDFVFFVLAEGGIRPGILSALVSGRIVDACPWADSGMYRLLLGDLLPVRARTLGYLIAGLHAYPIAAQLSHAVGVQRWYDVHNVHPVALPEGESIVIHQRVRQSADRNRDGAANDYALVDALQALCAGAPSPPVGARVPERLRTVEDVVFAVLSEGLRLLGLAGDELGDASRALLSAVDAAHVESSVALLLLARAGRLSGHSLQLPAAMESLVSSDAAPVRLLSRVFCALPSLRHDRRPWRGRVDADLAGFASAVRAVYAAACDAMDAVALRLWLEKYIEMPPENVSAIAARLPFADEPRCFVALLAKRVLSDPVAYTVEDAQRDFPNLLSPRDEMQNAANFWAKFRRVLQCVRGVPHLEAADALWSRVLAVSPFFVGATAAGAHQPPSPRRSAASPSQPSQPAPSPQPRATPPPPASGSRATPAPASKRYVAAPVPRAAGVAVKHGAVGVAPPPIAAAAGAPVPPSTPSPRGANGRSHHHSNNSSNNKNSSNYASGGGGNRSVSSPPSRGAGSRSPSGGGGGGGGGGSRNGGKTPKTPTPDPRSPKRGVQPK